MMREEIGMQVEQHRDGSGRAAGPATNGDASVGNLLEQLSTDTSMRAQTAGCNDRNQQGATLK